MIPDVYTIIPHSDIFILIDKVISINKNSIVGIKSINIQDWFIKNHFPNNPIMPGVLQLEAIAQLGSFFFLSKKKNPKNYISYLVKIDKTVFKNIVKPGNLLTIKVFILASKQYFFKIIGYCYIKKIITLKSEMILKIIKI